MRDTGPDVADLVVWRHLLDSCELADAVLSGQALELIAYVLLITGQREITVGPGPDWQQAKSLAARTVVSLPSYTAGADEVAAFVAGGFLDAGSSPVTLRFPYLRCRQSWPGSSWPAIPAG